MIIKERAIMKTRVSEQFTEDGKVIGEINSFLKEIYMDDTMKVFHNYDNTNSSELYMYYCGISACPPGHIWGPAIREHYVIHYILSGEGTLKIRGKVYPLAKNDGFLLSPKDIATYTASKENPWEYVWIGFHGLNVSDYLQRARLDSENPVFHYERGAQLKDCLLELVKVNSKSAHSADLRTQALLNLFFAELIENASQEISVISRTSREQYVRKAVEYIHTNYMKHITVRILADYIGLDRSYLTTLFKEQLNISPQAYLTRFRMNKACFLLKEKDISITEVALMSGYKDPVVFQKAFKNTLGISPSKYRSQNW
jgi:AraC-like DNA-binding protein